MSTVPRMRFFFREIAVVSSAITLIFFCSCERHQPDELPVEHAAPGAAEHEHAVETSDHAHQPANDDQHRATTAMSVTPAPTPAEFFPENSPH